MDETANDVRVVAAAETGTAFDVMPVGPARRARKPLNAVS
jgi:hypothetical protein